jgi:hypothetical protein
MNDRIVFLVGAGFNADATRAAGNANNCAYPLVSKLAELCFGLTAPPPSKSIEELFQAAIEQRNRDPVQRLIETLMEADHYTGGALARVAGNAYARFVQRFSGVPILTFNYDSLLELILYAHGMWRPEDGFGIPVRAHQHPYVNTSQLPQRSVTQVLHLHGSLCVYASEFEVVHKEGRMMDLLQPRDRAHFEFDPDKLSSHFPAFLSEPADYSYRHTDERIIAPVPRKAEGLSQSFVSDTYHSALKLLATRNTIVAIGYSFNVHDRESYDLLLRALSRKRGGLVLISPDPDEATRYIQREYPGIGTTPFPVTFAEWAMRDFHLPLSA